jgi:signal transduction histidine kinase
LIRNRAELALRRQAPPPELARELGAISETATRAIAGVRALSRGLRPPELDQLGLTQALRWLGQNVAETFGGKLEFQVGMVDRLLTGPAEVDVYRIAQEALNNAVRHSAASEITFEAALNGNEFRLSVFDNGRGLHVADLGAGAARGIGLKTMHERAALLDGRLEVRSEDNVGTRLTLIVPVPAVATGAL